MFFITTVYMYYIVIGQKRNLEDTKGVSRSSKSKKDRQRNDEEKNDKTTIYKTLHRKLKIEQHEPY